MTAPYTKQTWVNGAVGNTPLSARRLGVIEQGIKDATDGVIALEDTLGTIGTVGSVIQVGTGIPGAGTPIFPPIYLNVQPSPPTFWFLNTETNLWYQVTSAEGGGGGGGNDIQTGDTYLWYSSYRGHYDPVIRKASDDTTATQDSLIGGTSYYLDLVRDTRYFNGGFGGTSFRFSFTSNGTDGSVSAYLDTSDNPGVIRVERILYVYGLAQGDKVILDNLGKIFVQADSSGYLACHFTDTFPIAGDNSTEVRTYYWDHFPRVGFSLETSETDIGVDDSFQLFLMEGVPDTTSSRILQGVEGDTFFVESDDPGEILVTVSGASVGGPLYGSADFLIQWSGPDTDFDGRVLLNSSFSNETTITGLTAGDYVVYMTPRSNYGLGQTAMANVTVA